ncbi:MAG: polysaccharide deacetylase family protein [Candidatus Hydrogenedentes bacterium]|nr:polysaccharide deacetylase family protein [Candidatus Hydrogenedentota bacterium]
MNRRNFLSSAGVAAGTVLGLAAAQPAVAKAKTPWPNGKKWVYSITYDEGCEEQLKYAAPIPRKFGIPGHVPLVSSQLGMKRNVPGSSYHDMMILSPEQMGSLIDEGWGASCHSMTHIGVTAKNADVEVVEARKVLEEALGAEIPIFTVPGSNHGHPPAIATAPGAGYDAIMTIYDWVNTKSTDLLWLGRCKNRCLVLQRHSPEGTAYRSPG